MNKLTSTTSVAVSNHVKWFCLMNTNFDRDTMQVVMSEEFGLEACICHI